MFLGLAMKKIIKLTITEQEVRRVIDNLLPMIKQLDDIGTAHAKMQADKLEKVFIKIKEQSGLF